MINWQVRIKSKEFWIGIVGVIGAAVVGIAAQFGIQLDIGEYTDAISALITGVFAVLGVLGVTADPTTAGVSDSDQAMTYEEPRG